MIFTNAEGKTVGGTNGDTYYSKREFSKHFMRKFNAWGIDNDILKQFDGVNHIRILDDENDEVYATTVEEFKKHAIGADYGHGLQLFLPLDYWIKTKK